MRGLLRVIFPTVFGVLVVLCFAWPGAVAVVSTLRADAWADAGIGPRRLGLIARGVWVATAAALLALPIGAGLACGLTHRRSGRMRGLTAWVCLCVLLSPPYIYAYGWSLPLWPEGLPTGDVLAPGLRAWLATVGRAVWCLASWSAPVSAFILALGWRTHGRQAYGMAILDADGLRAARTAALPIMWPWLAISFACTWILAITEYSVCHLCLVQTWNTEILAELQLLEMNGGGFALAWPLMLLVGFALTPLLIFRARLGAMLNDIARLEPDSVGEAPASGGRWPRRLIVGSVLTALFLPWAVFILHLRGAAAFATVWRTYPNQWPNSVLCALASALACVVLAVGVDFLLHDAIKRRSAAARWTGWAVIAGAAIGAFTAPALVGDSFAAAYARMPLVADYWPIVSLVCAARFSLIAIVAMLLSGRSVHPQLARMAASDGASRVVAYVQVRLPLCLPTLLWAALATALLSLTEIAATLMVQPPQVPSLAGTLLNRIHFGRDDEVIALSLYVMMCVGAAVALLAWASSKRRGRALSFRR